MEEISEKMVDGVDRRDLLKSAGTFVGVSGFLETDVKRELLASFDSDEVSHVGEVDSSR